MRVITGSAKGRRLFSPADTSVRPTSDKVKEALFNIIQFDIEGRYVLDLFAGSGQLGIEAISRGASRCVFVDNSKASSSLVEQNVDKVGFADYATILTVDAKKYIRNTAERFDLIFIDPPYNEGLSASVLTDCAEHTTDTGMIIVESDRDDILPDSVNGFTVFRRCVYGKTALTCYKKELSEVSF